MAGLADLLTSNKTARSPARPRRARLVDLFGQPLQLRPAPRQAARKMPRTIAGVPIRDDEQLTEWLQANLDARAAQVGEAPQRVVDLAPTPVSRRKYALAMMRERLTPELQAGDNRYRRRVARTIRKLEDLDLGL